MSTKKKLIKSGTELHIIEGDLSSKGCKTTKNKVIVVLESREAAQALQKRFKRKILHKLSAQLNTYFGKKLFNKAYYIDVVKAPEPSDMLWNNLRNESHVKNTIRFLAAVGVTIIIAIGVVVLAVLKRYLKDVTQDQQSKKPNTGQYVSITISFLVATLVALANTIVGIFTRRFARSERHRTQTDFFISVGQRITAVLVLNMTLTTVLANFVWSRVMIDKTALLNLSAAGLVSDVFFLFITNSYMSSIFNYFDIVWGVKLLKRRHALKKGENCKLTQTEANSLFEGHPVDMALRFANVNKTLIFTGLFVAYIPLGFVFSMIGFIVVYWVDKFLILRRYVCANKLSNRLPKAMLHSAEWFLLAYAIGNFIMFAVPLNDEGRNYFRPTKSSPYFWFTASVLLLTLVHKFIIPYRTIYNKFSSYKLPRVDVKYKDAEIPETYNDYNVLKKKNNIKFAEVSEATTRFDRNTVPVGSKFNGSNEFDQKFEIAAKIDSLKIPLSSSFDQ